MNARQTALWAVHPKPIPGEVLSSWISRIAIGNAMTPRQFRRQCLPRVIGQGTDIDKFDADVFFVQLANGVGVSLAEARATGYAADQGRVFSRLVYNNLEWIVSQSTIRRGRRVQVLPYCPACLAADSIPFYRKHWRYAFLPACPEHGLLTNLCPSCGNHYSYLRDEADGRILASGICNTCSVCGRSFTSLVVDTSFRAQSFLDHVLSIQNGLISGLKDGWVEIPGRGQTNVCMYLRGMHDLATSIFHPEFGVAIVNWVESIAELEFPDWQIEESGESLEGQPSVVRAVALVVGTWLASDWPNRFIALVQALGIPVRLLLSTQETRPAWMLHDEVDALSRATFGRSKAEIVSARELLREKMKWKPTRGDIDRFMKTGEVGLIRPRSRPTTDEQKALHDRIVVGKKDRSRAKPTRVKEKRRAPPRTLDTLGAKGSEILDDTDVVIDDSTNQLQELARHKRQKNSQSTS